MKIPRSNGSHHYRHDDRCDNKIGRERRRRFDGQCGVLGRRQRSEGVVFEYHVPDGLETTDAEENIVSKSPHDGQMLDAY